MPKRHTKIITFLASALRSGSGASSGYDVSDWKEGHLLLNVTAIGGTPSAAMTIEESSDDITYHDSGVSITALTSIGAKTIVPFTNFGKYVRIGYAITGTATPTVTFAATGVFKD
jgi:hypothetical protein